MRNAGHAVPSSDPELLADELFQGSEPVHSAEDLAGDGIFEDGEVEEFLAELSAMRRSDVS